MTSSMMKSSQHLRASIATYTGVEFFPLAPRFENIYIEDLAHHLANVNRYAGACEKPYSVAQHCVHVAEYLKAHVGLAPLGVAERADAEDDIVKWGLLHDASEAYVSDICGPIKPFIVGYREIEQQLLVAVAQRFGLPWPMHPLVKYADKAIFAAERRTVMATPVDWWILHPDHPDADVEIEPWHWFEAKERYLQMFEELFGSDVLSAYRRP